MSDRKKILFQSTAMNDLITRARRFARSSAAVLITGESGTGKELFSQLLHHESPRAANNFVAVNCAAIPEMLVESELFGHERGAFTGAFQQRLGHFQTAHGGTLLLDEISEIPIAIQAKLLRVIEEQAVQKVGSSQPEKVDVRIIATSNRNLKIETATGNFRLDLFHRINVLRLNIPPLRERVEDIPTLTEYFLRQFRHEAIQPITGFTTAAMERLKHHHWPGNIRELRNVIHGACVECQATEIDVDCLPLLEADDATETESEPRLLNQPLADVEREVILASLEKHGGNKTAAANELGVTARTLSNKLKIYRAA